MTGRTHASIGFFTWATVCFALSILMNPLAVVAGSLAPDCDCRRSIAGRVLPLWRLGLRHRGATHTLWGMFFFSFAVGLLFGLDIALPFGLGYLSHLAADSLTPMGVRWMGKRKPPTR